MVTCLIIGDVIEVEKGQFWGDEKSFSQVIVAAFQRVNFS
jgi:hypothetical protein